MVGIRFRVHGVTDDFTECECCGKRGLKKTVRLIELDADGNDVDAVYYGTDCAARAAGTTKTKIRNAVDQYDEMMREARRWAEKALPVFSGFSVEQYIALNRCFEGRTAEAAEALARTIGEARQIMSGGGLVGTRFERELAGLPVLSVRNPAGRAGRSRQATLV